MSQSSSSKRHITHRQLDALNEVLLQVLSFRYPADQVVSRYFRAHRQLGAGDRRMIAETVYAGLRHYYRVKAMLAGENSPRLFALATLLGPRGYSVSGLEMLLSAKALQWAKEARGRRAPDDLSSRAELPPWVVASLQKAGMTDDAVLSLGRALQNPAPFDVRVNTILANRGQVLEKLRQEGIAAEPCRWAPDGIRLLDKPALQKHPLLVDGWVEVQDEGSQLVGQLVAPEPGHRVVDFCAGAGGKTLQIGALMENRGRIDAFDIAARRLQRLKPRLARSGLSNVRAQVIDSENDSKLKRLRNKADRVLVDAPCTGLGTIRRNPDLKFRQSEQSLAELSERQFSILSAAAKLVKPGGRLVYATCSLLVEENQKVVDRFLDLHGDFQRYSCARLLGDQKIDLEMGMDMVLAPNIHQTDGFYTSVLERQGH